MALYRAKTDGRGIYRFFEPEMDALMQQRRALELDLRKALVGGEFELYYQPLVNLEKEDTADSKHCCDGITPSEGSFRRLNLSLWQKKRN